MINNDRGQSLISKYVWVIETIYRRRKISFKELNERWLRDTDISRGVDIPKRTFDNWRYVIWDMFGISIVNENRGEYRYYIENEEDISKNGLRSWLYNTFCVSNALANSQSIKDRIILEYVPSGQNYLQPIIEAMKENHVLNMTYHSYWKDEENNFDVQPYCVKLFRQRWYLVARSTYSYYYKKGHASIPLTASNIFMLQKRNLKCRRIGLPMTSLMAALASLQNSLSRYNL